MNTQAVRLANTSHMMVQHSRGARSSPNGYAIGEQLRVKEDVDLQVEEEIVSVPAGTIATVKENNSAHVLLDLGNGLGQFVLEMSQVGKHFDRALKQESTERSDRRRVHESNPTVATPGAYVEITNYDPNIGSNRGPKSPGMGGYATLVGQKGMIATIFGQINGVKTYKIQLEKGGEFVFGETEFKVIGGVGTQKESLDESKKNEVDHKALMGLGFGL